MRKNKLFMIVMALCLVMCCVLAGCNTTGDANATAGNVDNSTGNGTVAPTDPTEPEFVLGIETAQKSPALYLTTAIEKTSAVMESAEKAPWDQLLTAMANKGSLSFSANIPEDNFNSNAVFAYENGVVYATVSMHMEEQDIKLELWFQDNSLCLKAPEILGENIYGVTFDNLRKDLPSSEIWALMGIRYDDIKDQIEPVLDQLEQYYAMLSGEKADLPQQVEDAVEAIILIFDKIQYTASESGTNAVSISCSMSKAQLDQLIDILMDASMEIDFGDIAGTSEVIEQLRAMLKEASGDVALNVVISNDTGLVTDVELKYTLQADGSTMCATMDLDMADLNNITATAAVTIDGQAMEGTILMNYRCNDTANKLDRKFTVKMDDEELSSFAVTYDGANLSVDFVNEGERYTLRCQCVIAEDKMELTNWSVAFENETMELPVELKVTLSVDCTIPEMPQFKNLLTMSEEDWMELAEIIEGLMPNEPAVPDDSQYPIVMPDYTSF